IVEICINGTQPENCTDVDNYAETEAWQQPISFDVPYGENSVILRYSGRKRLDSTGYLISLDRIDIEESAATPTPTPTATNTPSASVIEVDSVSSKKTSGRYNSITWSHTVNPGENRLLIVSFITPNRPHAWVKFNGFNLTKIAEEDLSNRVRNSMWYMLNPPVGTYTVQITLETGETSPMIGASASFHGIDQTDPFGEIASKAEFTQYPSVQVSSAEGELVYDTMANSMRREETPGAGQTEHWCQHTCYAGCDNGGNVNAAGSTEAGATSVTMSWSLPDTRHTALIAVPLKPAPLPTATPTAWPTPITQTPPQSAGTYENTDSAWYYSGVWYQVNDSGDSGGSQHASLTPWSAAQLTFTGNAFDFVYRKAPSYGIVELVVDGTKVASIDQYAESVQAQQSTHVTLSDGDHVLEIRSNGRKSPSSSGIEVNLDKIVVFEAATPTPTPSPTSTLTPTQTHTPTATPTYRWVTVGSIVSQDGENDHNVEFNHTVEDGEDRVLVVTYAHRRNSGQNVYAVKYNGVSMTQAVGDSIAGDYIVAIYYLINPPVGTHEVSIHLTTTAKTIAGAFTLYGVDLYDPIVDIDETTVYGNASLTLDSNPGDMAVDASVAIETGGLSFGEGQILQWTDTMTWTGGGMRSGSSVKSSEGTQITTSCNIAGSRRQAYIAAVFRAAQAEAPTPTPSVTPTATPTESPEQGWVYAYYEYSSINAGPHAVTSIDRGVTPTDVFEYDNIGNMTDRKESGTDWDQAFNNEGRLSQISDGSDTWDFTYDGDGVRVKQENPDGTTTLFLGGGAYEVHIDGQTTTVKKYYAITSHRVQRDNSGNLHYLLTDHLGSVVAALDGNGSLESDERYLPFGGLRDSSSISETDFAFTGQRNLSAIGLMDYNARFYSPSIGRFISADPATPGLLNPQSYNRYSYTINNPLIFVDPSGYYFCMNPDKCEKNTYHRYSSQDLWAEIFMDYGVVIKGKWSYRNKRAILAAIEAVGTKSAEITGGTAFDAFRNIYRTSANDPLVLTWGNCPDCNGAGAYTYGAHDIRWASMPPILNDPSLDFIRARNNIVHELGHALENVLLMTPEDGWIKPGRELVESALENDVLPERVEGMKSGFASLPLTWQMNPSADEGEVFADQFLGWVFNQWEVENGRLTAAAQKRSSFMNTWMTILIGMATGKIGYAPR
ncbi:MAG: hypothetical protein GTO18_00005, partial [Anaerolineales bacterium]|nr:hypothetical protein [Anaerolineales bacterium]